MKKILFPLAALAAGVFTAQASQPFNASLTPDVAICARTTQIDGVCLSIWGENPQSAFALGFVNGSTGQSYGFSLGLMNYDDSYHGVQFGLVNVSMTEFVGWQKGVINVASGSFEGWQLGCVDYGEKTTGLQSGVINYAENLNGVQFGLLNIAMNNPWFTDFPDKLATGFPIVNWSF